ncbi:MAG: ABC transporter ATP-binding protein [Clostridiales bacterium]|nr:ABC transporter ATP-binding protein [Clostridiales bacterium]
MAGHTYSPQALSRAVTKYTKNTYDRIEMKVTKESGLKNKILEHIAETEESMNVFLKRAVIETMERDKKKPKQTAE